MEVNEKRGRQGREPSKNFVRNENQEIYFKISRSNITFVYRRFFEGCKICKNTQQIINKLRPIIFSIMAKVIHVHLVGKRQDYYFGSISAVYSILTAEEVDVKKVICFMPDCLAMALSPPKQPSSNSLHLSVPPGKEKKIFRERKEIAHLPAYICVHMFFIVPHNKISHEQR